MTSPNARAERKEWIGLGVLLLACLIVSMDVSVLYFAVPFISRELEPSSTQQLWIFDIYGFVLAGLLITMGSLGDRIGRRRLLLLGAAAFGLASVAAAYAGSAEMLIAARAVLGVAGATLMPSTLALIRNMFHDEQQRSRAVAIWGAVMAGGVAVGPVLSGLLLERFWWGSIFLINTPVMALLLALAPLLVPEFKAPHTGRFDLPSSALSLLAVLPVIYGIKELARHGLELRPVIGIVVGLAFGAAFLHRQRTVAHPMIDLELFRRRGFSGSVLMNLLAMFAIVGCAVAFTQYLQSVLGMSPLEAALWSLVPSVFVGMGAPLASALAQRLDRAYVIGGGFLIAAAGFAELTLVRADSPLWAALTGASIYATGLVVVMSLGTELVLATAPPERAGSASALLESGSELGGALGMAILGSIGNAVYRGEMGDALPAGLPAKAADAARETLGGATAVAQQLPGRAGDAVLDAARQAFTQGLHATVIACATVMAAAAALSVALLRKAVDEAPIDGQPADDGDLAPSPVVP